MELSILNERPLEYIGEWVYTGMPDDDNCPLTFDMCQKLRMNIRCARQDYLHGLLEDTHGALAKLFAAADAGEVTDPEQLAVVDWLRADDGDVIESYCVDGYCDAQEVYASAIKLGQIALACQVAQDGGLNLDHEDAQYYISEFKESLSVEELAKLAVKIAAAVTTHSIYNVLPKYAYDLECADWIFNDAPDSIELDSMYWDSMYYLDEDEILEDMQEYYKEMEAEEDDDEDDEEDDEDEDYY